VDARQIRFNYRWCLALGVIALARPVFGLPSQHNGVFPAEAAAPRRVASALFTRLPLSFEVNKGQTVSSVAYLAHGANYTLFLTDAGAVLSFAGQANAPSLHQGAVAIQAVPTGPTRRIAQGTTLRLRLSGPTLSTEGATAPRVVGEGRLPGEANYFIGRDPRRWRTDVPTYARVAYHNLYPGVDAVYYGTQDRLEYDLVLAPGVCPDALALHVDGALGMRFDGAGDLLIQTPLGAVVQERPVIYQLIGGVRHPVPGHYVMADRGTIGFRVGVYDAHRPLVIDPVLHTRTAGGAPVNAAPTLRYATYVGGSNVEDGLGLRLDSAGEAYVTGTTSSMDFPVANSALGKTVNVNTAKVFVSKLNASGTALLYSTYLGGDGQDEADAIALDSTGDAFLTGFTYSPNFPSVSAFQPRFGGEIDAFVTKLNATGDRLVYSTYLGGSSIEGGFGLAVDAKGDAHVVGTTHSRNFPLAHAVQSTLSGSADAFVVELNSRGKGLVYATYYSGNANSESTGVAIDATGATYVVGAAFATNLATPHAAQTVFGGMFDAFVAKFSLSGRLLYSTYLGGKGRDRGQAIAVDNSGDAYIAVETESRALVFPRSPQPRYGGGKSDAVVAELDPAGDAFIYRTYLGGNGYDTPYGVAVDRVGNVYVAGITKSTNFPVVNALQTSLRGVRDAFVTKIDPVGNTLIYSSYFGGNKDDAATGIAVNDRGDVYICGQTTSTDLSSPGAVQSRFGGTYDAFVAKIGTAVGSPVGK